MWNKDEVKGKGKRIKGKIKDKVGGIIGNPELEADGEADRIEGTLQETIGRVRRKAGELVERAEEVRNCRIAIDPSAEIINLDLCDCYILPFDLGDFLGLIGYLAVRPGSNVIVGKQSFVAKPLERCGSAQFW